jgi:hypothetical protein
MAPELHGGAEAGFVTDVYSLGCLLWVALTGTPPYTGASDYQVIGAHVTQPIPQLAGTSPMVQATNRILRFAMAKEPAQRYPTAAAMRADLQAALRLPHTAGAAVPEQSGGTALRPVRAGAATPGTAPAHDRWAPGGGTPPGPPPAAPPPYSPGDHHERTTRAHGAGGGDGGGRRSRTRWIVAGVAAGVLALATGVVAALTVGDDPDPDPPDPASEFVAMDPLAILRASEKEMKVLDSVRVRGQFPDPDQGGQQVSVDLVVTANGDCAGTMGYIGKGSAQLLRMEDRVMVKPSPGFLSALAIEDARSFVDALDGRWLEFPDDPDQFASVCDLDEFLERDDRDGADVTNEGVVTEQGQDAVKIHLQEGSNQETYFVMVAEPHYTLRIDEQGDALFKYSEFDEPLDARIPAEDEIVTSEDLVAEQKAG